jgi:putative membrane protein
MGGASPRIGGERRKGAFVMSLLLYFVVMAAAMLCLARVLPGFVVEGWVPAFLAAVVLAIVNTVVKPILFVLTLPFTILTLGLFLFVLNAICLWLTAVLVPGFRVSGFGTTLIASLLLAIVSMVWKAATRSS